MWKALPLCSLRRLASLLVLLMVVKRLVEKQQTRRIPLHCSLGDQVAFLGDKDRDDGHQRKKIRAEMKDPLTAEGVCGPIMRSMKIPLDDDSEIDWWFLHPCAFLHELCKKYSPTLKNEIKWGTYVVKFHFLISFLSVCLCVYTSNKPVIAVQSYTCLMQGATWVLGGRLPTKTPAGICETLWLARMHVPAF